MADPQYAPDNRNTRKNLIRKLSEDEEKFRTLVEPWAQAVWEANAEGMTVSDSESWRAFTGQSVDEIMEADGWLNAIHPEDRESAGRHWREAVLSKLLFSDIFRLHRSDGSWRWTLVRAAPLFYPDGSVRKWVGMNIDIHDRKVAETALQESEAKTRSIFRAAPIGIGVLSDRIIQDVNDRLCQITGYARDELIGSSARMLYPTDDDFEYVGREKYRQIKMVGTGTVEVPFKCKNGRKIVVLLSSTPLDPDDLAAGVTFTVMDITERKRVEDALRESEQKYRSLFENSPDAVLLTYPEGSIIAANPAACAMLGYSEQELIERGRFGILDANDPRLAAALEERMRTGRIHARELTAIRKGGEHFPVEVDSVIMADEPVRSFVIMRDITQRKQTEKVLYESEERLRIATQSADMYAWEIDLNTERVKWSENAQSRIAFPLPKTLAEIWAGIHADDISTAKLKFDQAVEGSREFKIEYRLAISASATETWVFSAGVPIRDTTGNPVRIVGVTQDITKRKSAEIALKESRARLEEALSGMRYLNEHLEEQVAERTALAEKRAKQLQLLAVDLIETEEKERQRIAALLHDDLQQLLASARLQLQAASQRSNPAGIIRNVERLLGESIEKSRGLSHELSPPVLHQFGLVTAVDWLIRHMNAHFGLKVQLKTETKQQLEDTPLKVFLFRAVQELLFNVVKHAGVKSARVTLSSNDKNIFVVISDQGIGFHPEALSQSVKSGLGLVSLRERANAIGGDLHIESAPGQGSRFALTVPVSLPEIPALPNSDVEIERHALMQKIKAGVPDAPAGSEIRLLLADDHKVMRQGLIGLISDQPGISVVGEASNGKEALDLARQLRPSLVLMDISMPGMDGLEATRQIKAELPDVRVIGLSMLEDEDIARKMKDAGAEAFVTKTASSDELMKAIYGMAGQGKYRKDP